MKSNLLKILAIVTLAAPLLAHEKGEGKKEAGPNGGRLITIVEPNLEFLITPERKVEITPIANGKAVPFTGQIVAVTGGDRSQPTRLEFTQTGGKLVSTNALPKGERYPISVSIKTKPDAKAVYERLTFDLSKCPTCKLSEYACICAH